MTRDQVQAILDSIKLPESWRFSIRYPVSWKQYKKWNKNAKYQEYLDGWLATTDTVDKIIYIAPYYVKYFTPMTLIQTIWHELGHVQQKSTKGGHHNKDWFDNATEWLYTPEDEYAAKDILYDRIHKSKDFNRRVKLFMRTQKVKHGYYIPLRLRDK